MSKGQFFFIAMVLICISLASLASIYYYSDMPMDTQMTFVDQYTPLMDNVQNELSLVIAMNASDDARINDFISIIQNYTEGKGYNVTIY